VGVKYPDGRFVDRSGAVIFSQSTPGFCIDHARVRREANVSPALSNFKPRMESSCFIGS